MSNNPVENVRAQMAQNNAIRSIVMEILDRCDRRGIFPKQVTLRCGSEDDFQAAVSLFSASAVRLLRNRDLVARLDLDLVDSRLRNEGWAGLAEILYEAAERTPLNLAAETTALGSHAAQYVAALAESRTGATRAFLQASAARLAECRGEFFLMARTKGLSRLKEEIDIVARCIELAERNENPIRLANFARRATGSTKGLRAGDQRYTLVAEALLEHVPHLADRVSAEAQLEAAGRRRLAMECLGIFRNETPIDVLCWGHIILEKKGRIIETVALHHEIREPCRLLLLHLRNARVVEVKADRVVSIENETTFNDYIEWLQNRSRAEIVLLSEGQANWAVVQLLHILTQAAPALPIVHWGDMDRSGTLILRSLRKRTGLPIEPLWMDVATFERFKSHGLPLPPDERAKIESLMSVTSDEVCTDLLGAIRAAGRWIEQETVAEEMLGIVGAKSPN